MAFFEILAIAILHLLVLPKLLICIPLTGCVCAPLLLQHSTLLFCIHEFVRGPIQAVIWLEHWISICYGISIEFALTFWEWQFSILHISMICVSLKKCRWSNLCASIHLVLEATRKRNNFERLLGCFEKSAPFLPSFMNLVCIKTIIERVSYFPFWGHTTTQKQKFSPSSTFINSPHRNRRNRKNGLKYYPNAPRPSQEKAFKERPCYYCLCTSSKLVCARSSFVNKTSIETHVCRLKNVLSWEQVFWQQFPIHSFVLLEFSS